MAYFGSSNIIPLNTLDQDPNLRSSAPLVLEIHRDVELGAMTSGVVTKTVDSALGKDKGEVLGVFPFNNKGDADNEILSFTASEGSSGGEVDVKVTSSDNTATDNNTRSFLLIGFIYPEDAS